MVLAERALLEDGGHEVETHELANPRSQRDTLAALVRAPWNSSAARSVVQSAERFGADVVHVHNTWFALSPAVFPTLARAGFATVATVHNYRLACVNAILYRDGRICQDCLGRSPWRGVAHACYRGSRAESAVVAVTIAAHRRRRTWAEDVDVVVALTEFAADVLVESGVPAGSIEVKPNTAPDPGGRPASPSASSTVLFVGRLTEEKGVLDLMAAWKTAAPIGLSLEVIGDGPLREQVERQAAPAVHIAGFRSSGDVRRLMHEARALVVPSRWFEGLPMVVVEALGSGLPVVIPGHGALPEMAGGGGLVFTGGDVGSLAIRLAELTNDDLVDEHGAAGRSVYESRYAPAAGLARLEEIYSLAQARRRGR